MFGISPDFCMMTECVVFGRKKNPEDDPTWRHKKWLKEFAERRHDMIDMVEEKTNEMEDKKQRFREKQVSFSLFFLKPAPL